MRGFLATAFVILVHRIPFNVGVKQSINPAKVLCYGPGVDSKKIDVGKPVTFIVDTTQAGEAPLEITYTDQTGQQKPAIVVSVAKGKFNATYVAVEEGNCRVDVKYANLHVPGSPFNMRVEPGFDANKVKVSGAGIEPHVMVSMPQQFTVDYRKAGVAELSAVIQRPYGTYIRPSAQDNGDGTSLVQYTPDDMGRYMIDVRYGGQSVKQAPFTVFAVSTGDASKCKLTEGHERTIHVGNEAIVSIDASSAGIGKVTCRIRNPSGSEIDVDIIENVDGSYDIIFTPSYPGSYNICIKFGGAIIPDGEYTVQAI